MLLLLKLLFIYKIFIISLDYNAMTAAIGNAAGVFKVFLLCHATSPPCIAAPSFQKAD